MRETMTPTEAMDALRALREQTLGAYDKLRLVETPDDVRLVSPRFDVALGLEMQTAQFFALAHNAMHALLDVVEAAQDVVGHDCSHSTGSHILCDPCWDVQIEREVALETTLARLATVVAEEVGRG